MIKKKIIVSVTTDLYSDQRVHKTCLSLSRFGYDVLVVGRYLGKNILSKQNEQKQRPYDVKRFHLFFNKGFLFYMTYNIRLFFFLFFNKFDILLSNDLDTLLPNYIISKIKRKSLVYDSHELFTEVPELKNRNFIKSFWLFIEGIVFPKLNHIITVSNSISDYYNKKYKKKLIVIRNVPNIKSDYKSLNKNYLDNIMQKINCVNGYKIIYQGSLNKDRGIELMIDCMSYVEATLFIVGDGDVKKDLEKMVILKKMTQNVIFLGRVPFFYLNKITSKMDLGLSFEEDACLAYKFALPNKIFDYIHAKIPVLVSDLPEMKALVNKYNVGQVLKSRAPKLASQQIINILENKSNYIDSVVKAKTKLCWENEEKKLIRIFKNF